MKILIFIVIPLFLLFNPRYEQIFPEGYDDALFFLEQHSREINQALDTEEQHILIPVIFPELMRHSLLMDFFQERAMEIIYVNYGKEKADFSIGEMQMKPSFAEAIEKYVSEHPDMFQDFAYMNLSSLSNDKAIRKERIKRLKSFYWQLHYLKAFYKIMEVRFDDVKWNGARKKIKIFATAYNHDFKADISTLEKWSARSLFPYGADSDREQYAYSKISLYFYSKDWPAMASRFSAGKSNGSEQSYKQD